MPTVKWNQSILSEIGQAVRDRMGLGAPFGITFKLDKMHAHGATVSVHVTDKDNNVIGTYDHTYTLAEGDTLHLQDVQANFTFVLR